MKLSNSFFYTLRENVKNEDSISSNLLVKAGMIKKSSAGVYMFMPLGYLVKSKIENIIREEMNNAGATELIMPALIPEDVFIKSGRRDSFGNDMFSLKDRALRNYVLGPTHEELFVEAAAMKIKSYRDMPFNIYQFQNKFRDETRPRYGLIRTREFTMKDAYSFDIDLKGAEKSYQKMYEAYNKIFDRLDLNYCIVKADTGAMGGLLSEEYQAITDIGEDTVVLCDKCDFASNIEIAPVKSKESEKETPKPKELIETTGVATIEDLVKFLNISIDKTVKTLVCSADGEVVLAIIKGNRDLNETKLAKVLGVKEIEMATTEQLKTITDASFGSLGPIGVKCKVIIDNEVNTMSNFVVGGNITGYHYINVNLTDFDVYKVADIVNIKEGNACPNCGGHIYFKKGIEVGNLFNLGTKYSESLGLTYLDQNNETKPVVMGSYGIGTARCMAAIVEQHNDEKGIIWPVSVSPFTTSIVVINSNDEKQMAIANKIYDELAKNKIDVLLDDRDERPGVKFNDMDLIGIPYRITVGKKITEGIVELKSRDGKIDTEIEIAKISEEIKNFIK